MEMSRVFTDDNKRVRSLVILFPRLDTQSHVKREIRPATLRNIAQVSKQGRRFDMFSCILSPPQYTPFYRFSP